MPNGNKNNNGKKTIELLPEEMRRRDEGKKQGEERRDVKFFIPPEEKKEKEPTWKEKFFSRRGETKPPQKTTNGRKNKEEPGGIDIFKMKVAETPPAREQERPQPRPIPPPPPPPPPPPKPVKKELPPPPRQVPPARSLPPREVLPAKKRMGITLMPEDSASPEERKRPKQKLFLVVIIVILVMVLGGLYGILKWSEMQVTAEIKKIEDNITLIDQQIKTLDVEKNQAQITQKKLQVAGKIMEKHVYWTNLFSFLEANTVPDVYFGNLVGGSDGQVTMSGAAKSYKAVGDQIISFRADEDVEKVSILGASASIAATGETTEVDFEARLKLLPEIFFK